MPLWNQEMNNVRDSLITDQVGGMSLFAASTAQVNSTISVQNNYNMPAYVQQDMKNQLGGLVHTPSISQVHHPTLVSFQEAERHQPRFQLLNDFQNMFLSNSQTEFSNGVSESSLYREGNPTNNTATANYVPESNLYREGNPTNNTSNAQNMVDDIVVMPNNLSSSDDSLIYPQDASWPQSFYSSVNSDPTMGYFGSAHDFNDDWIWKS